MTPRFKARLAIILLALAPMMLWGQSATAQPPAAASRPSDIPAPVRAWAEAWNQADAAGMAALFTADAVYEDLAFQVRFEGTSGIAEWVRITAAAMPDARVEVVDAFRAGDRIAARWIFRGTPGRLGALASTGRSFAVPVVSIFVMDGERIRQVSDYYNLADLLRQVGLPAGAWTPPGASDALRQ